MRLKNTQKAFTFIEVVLVIALLGVVGSLTLPLGVRFYETQVLEETVDGITFALVDAQHAALLGKNDDMFGVKFLSDSYVFFQGKNYTERLIIFDRITELPDGISFSGLSDEIIFSKNTGTPSVNGVMVVSLFGRNEKIIIPEIGIVMKE